MNACWILSSAFSASLSWSCDLYLFCWYDWCNVSHWVICKCWTIFGTPEWVQLDHGGWLFLNVLSGLVRYFCRLTWKESDLVLACCKSWLKSWCWTGVAKGTLWLTAARAWGPFVSLRRPYSQSGVWVNKPLVLLFCVWTAAFKHHSFLWHIYHGWWSVCF